MELRSIWRRSAVRLLAVGVLVVAAVGATPLAAQADTVRTATSSGWGRTPELGAANARNNAIAELNRLARSLGETCWNITATATHVYTAPDGSAYVYNGTATGTCGPVPPNPYVVPRSATTQAGGATQSAAISAGDSANRSAILAVGVACTGWSTSSSFVWAAPGGVWHIYNVTTSAMCTN